MAPFYVLNRQMIDYSHIPLKDFAKYLVKRFHHVTIIFSFYINLYIMKFILFGSFALRLLVPFLSSPSFRSFFHLSFRFGLFEGLRFHNQQSHLLHTSSTWAACPINFSASTFSFFIKTSSSFFFRNSQEFIFQNLSIPWCFNLLITLLLLF